MKIDLSRTKFYFLTVDTNSLRKKHMMEAFKNYDITEVNPVVGIGRRKSGAIGMSRMIDLGIKNQDRRQKFQPFVIMEDDVSMYREFPEYLDIPDDADMLYLGISLCGMHQTTDSHQIFAIDISQNLVRIFNMLSCHGIMVCSALGAINFQKCMMEAYFTDKSWDILCAYSQPYHKVYALKVPLVYQDKMYEGQEEETRFELKNNSIDSQGSFGTEFHENIQNNYYNQGLVSYQMCNPNKQSSIVIAFEKGVLLGGLGDRIIGLVSCKLIAHLLGYNFYIYWNKENVRDYINYLKYDFELRTHYSDDVKIYDCIDNQISLKNYLMNETNLFPNTINKFYLNQEITQYLYKNPLFAQRHYYQDIMDTYKRLYLDILKPTDKLLSLVNQLVDDRTKIVGIQIRAGDRYMITNSSESHYTIDEPETNIENILVKIKDHCPNYYYIFITSDYPRIYQIALKIWDEDTIIYENSTVQHIDRSPVNPDLSKIFIDNYILSQKSDILYISDYSNFGRIAALSCRHDNIFNLHTEKINVKNLLSKHEILA